MWVDERAGQPGIEVEKERRPLLPRMASQFADECALQHQILSKDGEQSSAPFYPVLRQGCAECGRVQIFSDFATQQRPIMAF